MLAATTSALARRIGSRAGARALAAAVVSAPRAAARALSVDAGSDDAFKPRPKAPAAAASPEDPKALFPAIESVRLALVTRGIKGADEESSEMQGAASGLHALAHGDLLSVRREKRSPQGYSSLERSH
jgi:hypothetical protein